MLKRIQLNSRTNRIDVFRSFPTLELDKKYVLKIDNVYLPTLDAGFIPNEPLFSMERRALEGSVPCDADFVSVDEVFIERGTFIPDKCNNVVELVYQINYFLRKFFSEMRTGVIEEFDDEKEMTDQPDNFTPIAAHDWFEEMNNVNFAQKDAIQCILQNNGVISFRFTLEVQTFIVIKFTDLGKHIMGPDNIYLAPMIQGVSSYLDEVTREVRSESSGNDFVFMLGKSAFSQNEHRPEIVIRTTLPLQNTVECNENHSKIRNQLTAYRYPVDKLSSGYNMIKFRHFTYSVPSRLLFEQNNKSNNEFLITGTELQNFHLELSLRYYEFDAARDEFDEKLIPYNIDPDHHWSIVFLINQTNI
jgi:hypothetical protein